MLGTTSYELQAPDAAIRYLNRALAQDENFAQAHYLLGLISHQQQRPTEAREHFTRFLSLDPDSEAAGKVRNWMERHVESR